MDVQGRAIEFLNPGQIPVTKTVLIGEDVTSAGSMHVHLIKSYSPKGGIHDQRWHKIRGIYHSLDKLHAEK